MFQWDKSVNFMKIPADKVIQLFRSMREVQLALPGVPAQQASAYLCQYLQAGGVATTVAFHLHKSNVLAFYFSEPRVVPEQKSDSMLDQGLNFVESMGFLMTDQDIHLLDQADQEMLWSTLPLMNGLLNDEQVSRADAITVALAAEKIIPRLGTSSVVAAPQASQNPVPVAEGRQADTVPTGPFAENFAPESEAHVTGDNVNDLLAAVDAMRAKRPGLRARKAPPSVEEMQRRRTQLRENVGRILASL